MRRVMETDSGMQATTIACMTRDGLVWTRVEVVM